MRPDTPITAFGDVGAASGIPGILQSNHLRQTSPNDRYGRIGSPKWVLQIRTLDCIGSTRYTDELIATAVSMM